jgi:hypothetical protein
LYCSVYFFRLPMADLPETVVSLWVSTNSGQLHNTGSFVHERGGVAARRKEGRQRNEGMFVHERGVSWRNEGMFVHAHP